MLLFWLFCAAATAIIAGARGRSVIGWLLLGLLFGIFALIVVAVIPAPPDHIVNRRDYLPCPFCREPINKYSTKCKHCHSSVKLVRADDHDAPAPASISHNRSPRQEAADRRDGTTEQCAYCSKSIRPEATRCWNCKKPVRS